MVVKKTRLTTFNVGKAVLCMWFCPESRLVQIYKIFGSLVGLVLWAKTTVSGRTKAT